MVSITNLYVARFLQNSYYYQMQVCSDTSWHLDGSALTHLADRL